MTGRPALVVCGAFTLTTGQVPWASRVGRRERARQAATRTAKEKGGFMAVFVYVGRVGVGRR